jgi:glycosyltransferase involved in cell wall biosynthesis
MVDRIDNGVDLDRWRPLASTNVVRDRLGISDALVIGFVGRLSPEKGLDLLLDAVAEVPSVNGRELRLLLAGDGELRPHLEELTRQRGLSHRVSFFGECKNPSSVYLASDAIVLTSVTEGSPMAVLEAMASGRPVIATAVGDLPRIIDPGVTGWLLEHRDSSALAELFRTELIDAERLRRMGAAARAVAEQRFSSARMAASYLEIYRRVIQGSAAANY